MPPGGQEQGLLLWTAAPVVDNCRNENRRCRGARRFRGGAPAQEAFAEVSDEELDEDEELEELLEDARLSVR
jgi:hypothetical protein